eukprot:g7610.t1
MARLQSSELHDSGESAAPSSELWTLQEEAQGVVAPGCQFVPLTRRRASFSVDGGGNNDINHSSHCRNSHLLAATSIGHDEVTGADNTRDGPSSDTNCLVNGEGFPLLLRRRTFTEPSFTEPSLAEPSFTKRRCFSSVDDDREGAGRGHLYYGAGGGGGGGRGKVPLSVSEDNMLSLLSKRSSKALEAGSRRVPPPTPATTPIKLERDVTISSSVSNSSGDSFSSSIDADSEGVGGSATGMAPLQTEGQEGQAKPAADRARRNEFVIRLHRLGLVQDVSRCMMDIVEGRSAAAKATAVAAAPLGGLAAAPPVVNLEEVREHLRSLPERYALSVDPEDALNHMALIADAVSTPSTVRVLVKRSSDGGGTTRGAGARYTVTVACGQSPLLLGAVLSSLRSSGATCVDADVVTTAPKADHATGVSLARFEIEIARGAGAAAAATATKTGAVSHSKQQAPGEEEAVDGLSANARLAEVLSSKIAANIRTAEREEREQQRAMEGEDERAGDEELRGGGTCRGAHPDTQRCPTNARAGVAGAAEAEADANRAGRRPNDSSAACGASTAHREARRKPLARRQGCFFLAEADANALGSNGNSDAISFGGGRGRGDDGDGCVDKPLSSRSDDADAFPNVCSRGNNGQAGCNGGLPQRTSSASNNPATTPPNNSPNDDDGESCYRTIPTEDIELLELAGRGRFSRTYRARWRGVTVAVKTLELPPESDAPASFGSDRSVIVAEFERELNIVRKLRHPNICHFRGVCVASPHHVSLVYDFLANGTLGDRLRDKGGNAAAAGDEMRRPLPLRSAGLARIVKDVVDGMLYLHELGVLHRDLKPDNILLDAEDRAVIADFGLSRLCQPTNEHTAETGTYRWMAPEVIRHEPYGYAADVYSFGVVLWQVLTRRQPFEGLTPIQAAFSVARQGLRPPFPPSAPSALCSLMGRCWHQTPEARPSFSQVRSELPEIERQMLSL